MPPHSESPSYCHFCAHHTPHAPYNSEDLQFSSQLVLPCETVWSLTLGVVVEGWPLSEILPDLYPLSHYEYKILSTNCEVAQICLYALYIFFFFMAYVFVLELLDMQIILNMVFLSVPFSILHTNSYSSSLSKLISKLISYKELFMISLA